MTVCAAPHTPNANELAMAGPSAAAQTGRVESAGHPPDPLPPSDVRGRSIAEVPPRQRRNRGMYGGDVGQDQHVRFGFLFTDTVSPMFREGMGKRCQASSPPPLSDLPSNARLDGPN